MYAFCLNLCNLLPQTIFGHCVRIRLFKYAIRALLHTIYVFLFFLDILYLYPIGSYVFQCVFLLLFIVIAVILCMGLVRETYIYHMYIIITMYLILLKHLGLVHYINTIFYFIIVCTLYYNVLLILMTPKCTQTSHRQQISIYK